MRISFDDETVYVFIERNRNRYFEIEYFIVQGPKDILL